MPLPPQRGQKPDSAFRGVQGIVMNPISLSETRAWGKKCDPAHFLEVFEIESSFISRETMVGEFQIELSVLEPGRIDLIAKAFNGPLHFLVQRHDFKDLTPWLTASLVRLA